jgi:hypothetical protein
VNPHFGDTFAHGLAVAKIAVFRAVDPRLDAVLGGLVAQTVEPSIKYTRRDDRFHIRNVS